MKKSALLIALPLLVVTKIRPEPVAGGAVALIDVIVEELTGRIDRLSRARILLGRGSKLVPEIVTAVPGVPMVGVKPVIVGAPLSVVTVKTEALVAEPLEMVTPIEPVVALEGTVVTICVAVDDVTVVATPLICTMF